jgi:membrane protein involved in colicin uptake
MPDENDDQQTDEAKKGDDATKADDATKDDGKSDNDQLGDAGKRALKAERDARAKAEREHKKTLAELEKLRNEGLSDQERAVAEAKTAGRAEATAEATARIIKAEIKAAAAGRFADPTDALAFIGVDDFEVNSDGDVDPEKIKSAIDQLLENKPHLAATAGKPNPGNPDGGSRGTNAAQLTAADLKTMTPQQIVEARKAGRLADYLASST